MPRKTLAVFAVVLLLPTLVTAAEPNRQAGKPAQRVDKEPLAVRLRAAIRNRHGQGIEKSKSDLAGGGSGDRTYWRVSGMLPVGQHEFHVNYGMANNLKGARAVESKEQK